MILLWLWDRIWNGWIESKLDPIKRSLQWVEEQEAAGWPEPLDDCA